jgi:hypothetical protein
VTDLNTAATSLLGKSVIYQNFAYAIANTTIRYLLNGAPVEGGVDITTPPTTFDNVFVP